MSDTVFDRMVAVLGLDKRDYDRGLRDAEGQARGFGKIFDTALSGVSLGSGIGVALKGVELGFAAVGRMMGFVERNAIGMNATLEDSTSRFTQMMGDADRAKEHVEGLFRFAKETPFEADPVIEASAYLRTFGRDALDTRTNLRMVGDAAAGTKAPIQELGFWTGRLYSNLKAGQPFGEAAMRLQELAVLSPEARAQMEALQKQGASMDEIWQVFTKDMERFNGAMGRMSNNWTGLSSSLADSINILTARGLRPLFDGGKEVLRLLVEMAASPAAEQFADKVSAGLSRGLQAATDTAFGWANAFLSMDQQTDVSIGRILGFMDGAASYAYTWGQQIVSLFAEGIVTMLGEVAWAINEIGDMIGYWMEPHSPPRFLPNIDKWGRDTALVWLRGWRSAPLNDLKGFMAGIDAQIKQAQAELTGVQGQLGAGRDFAGLGANQRAMRLRQELKRTDLSPERRRQLELQLKELTLQSRINRLSMDRAAIERKMQQDTQSKTLKAMKSMEEAAGRIAKAIEKGLSPLEQALKAAQLQQAELRDLIRLKQLDAILNDENSTAAEKQLALLEKQEIAIRRGLRAKEAAELGVDLSYLQDIPIVLEDIDKGAGKAKAGVGGLVGDLGSIDLSGISESAGTPLLNLEERIAGLQTKYQSFTDSLTTGASEGRLAWENMATAFEENTLPIRNAIQTIEDGLNGAQRGLTSLALTIRSGGANVASELQKLSNQTAQWLQAKSDETAQWFQTKSDETSQWLQTKSDETAQWLQGKADEFGQWSLDIMGGWTLAIDRFTKEIFRNTVNGVLNAINSVIAYLNSLIVNANASLGTTIPTIAPVGGGEVKQSGGVTAPKAADVSDKVQTNGGTASNNGDTFIIQAPTGNAADIKKSMNDFQRSRRAMGY